MIKSTNEEAIDSLYRVARRRTLLVLLFAIALTAGIIYISYLTAKIANWSILESNEKKIVELAHHRSSTEISTAFSDAAFLARDEYLRHWLTDGSDSSRRSMEREYLAFAHEKQFYDQIRFIDQHGQEIVRIEQDSPVPRIVPREDLQNKSSRYYFIESMSLKRGQIYISPFDLNVEHGKIEQPIKPTTRIGIPVFDKDGHKRGVVILNYRGTRILSGIRNIAAQSEGDLWLVNSRGFWLIGPSLEEEWAFMYPDRQDRSFKRAYPDAWTTISRRTGLTQFFSNGDFFTFTAISPTITNVDDLHADSDLHDYLSQEAWILVSHVSAKAITAAQQPHMLRFGAIFLIVALLETAAAWLVLRHWASRQAAELAAARSEEKFRALLESAPDGIVVTDFTGKIVLINSQIHRMLGYDRDELIGRPVEILVPESYRGPHIEMRTKYLEAPAARQLGGGRQLWAVRKDGTELPVDISLSPVVSGSRGLVYASVRDMTERYQKELTIQDMAERLARDNVALNSVNKELDSFCYSVSHDLRAPLRGMTGFCQALVEDYGDKLDETGKDYVERISAASKRMGQLIDDLLMLSRVTRTEVTRTDVNLSVMAESIAEQLKQSDPNRQVEFKIHKGLTVQGDDVLLGTLLENLLGNAWKYSAKNPHAVIEFGIATNGAEPSFFIRDDGVGFDMTHADKLFKPFQRLHRSSEFEGTGIGLASVANIVRRHGGRIWADSKPGAGTTMHFTL
ncbi:MAG TPA: PAS domain S-box protein [Desulfuromonadales bacterium]|nr:PAS domain S-box protein [Desulfuromonadales bacterium]